MKYRLMIALLAALCLAFSGAWAQPLPDLTVFSPGLTRAGELLEQGERVEMTAAFEAKDMLYARDLSLLRAMMSGMQLNYSGSGSLHTGEDCLAITRDEETLFTAGFVRSGGVAEVLVNGEAYGLALSEGSWEMAAAAGDRLTELALLDRVPLLSVCTWFEGLKAGDTLAGGFAVTQAFEVERTMSDDGTRLTKINISGQIAREGETPWSVSGYLRQPAGRAPKDTFELVFTQDEKHTLTATYSSTRSQSVAKKDQKGRVIVDTALEVSGKLDGYGVTTRLKLRMQNDWTAGDGDLTEKLVMTATLGLTDRTPGRRMQRLNDASAKLRCEMTVSSAENSPVAMTETSSLNVTFDGNTFLDVGIDGSVLIGGEAEPAALMGAQEAAPQDIRGAFENAVTLLAQRIYAQLSADAQGKAEQGLR